jgi:hypothetical protein
MRRLSSFIDLKWDGVLAVRPSTQIGEDFGDTTGPNTQRDQTRQWKIQHRLKSATVRPFIYVKKAIFQCPIGALLVHPDLPKVIFPPSKH